MANERSVKEWADAWIQWWNSSGPERDEFQWAADKEFEAIFSDPELVWRLVEEISSRKLSDRLISVFAAGPLEDLLAQHGALMIERVEIKAKKEQSFASMLGGVWQNDMSGEIWQRVQAAWDRRGWDGIPD